MPRLPRSIWLLVVAWVLGCTRYDKTADDHEANVSIEAQELPQREDHSPIERGRDGLPKPATAPQKLRAVPIEGALEPGSGALVVAQGERRLAIPLQYTTVETTIAGTIAETTVTQLFVNPFTEPIEALYLFPLPHDAAVDDYWFHVGQRHMHGVMQERQDAAEIHEDAHRDDLTAVWLEQERPNVFWQSVANIAPGETILVEVHMVHRIEPRDGIYTFAFPTVVSEQYRTGREAGQGYGADDAINPSRPSEGTRSGHDIAISVTIAAGLQPRELTSASHRIITEQMELTTKVRLADDDVIPDQNFVLSWKLGDTKPSAWITTQRRSDAGYFMLTVMPPSEPLATPVRGRELVFVVDTSSSMRGEPMESVKRAVAKVLDGMGPDDAFQVLQVSESVSRLGTALVPNTPAHRARARKYVEELHATDGVDFFSPLGAALRFPRDPARMRLVMFITDGYVPNDREVYDFLVWEIADTRLFTFGLGKAPNRALLDGMALFGGGSATYVRPDESMAAAIDRFDERVTQPVLTDVTIDFGELAVHELMPTKIPDLFAGQPLVVFGKIASRATGTEAAGEPHRTVTVHGRLGGEEVSIPVVVDLASATGTSAGIASMWARKRIDDLVMGSYAIVPNDHSGWADLRRQIVDLALTHAIMTEYTAFVTVGDQREVDRDGKVSKVHGMGLVRPGRGGTGAGTIGLGNVGLIEAGGGSRSGYDPGLGPADRHSRVSVVRQGRAEVVGSLDRDIIRRVVSTHIDEVRHCYDQGLIAKPELAGRITISFIIAPLGNVSYASVKTSMVDDANVEQCLLIAIGRWTFPKPKDGGTVDVEHPFVFTTR